MTAPVVLVAIALVAACATAPAHPAPARSGPSPAVRAAIDEAEAAEKARHHDVARAAYERAVTAAREPDDVRYARREFAETLETWGDIGDAIAQLEAEVSVVASDASSWNDLGVLYHHQGDDRRAVAALETAKRLAPRDFRPRIALASLRWATHDLAGATTEYRALLELELPDRLRAKVQWALDQLAAAPPPAS